MKENTNNTSATKNNQSISELINPMLSMQRTFANPNNTGGERAIALASMIATILSA